MPDELKNAIEHEKLSAEIRAIAIQMEANNTVVGRILTDIEQTSKLTYEQAKKTNGRVDNIEATQEVLEAQLDDDLGFIRFFRKRKWLIALFIFAIIKLYQAIPLEDLFLRLIRYII